MSSEKDIILRPKLQARVFKIGEEQNGKTSIARKLLVNVLYWTEFPSDKLEKVIIKNIENKVQLLLKINRVKGERALKQLIPVVFCEVLTDGIGDNKFEFNSEIRNLLEIIIKDKSGNQRPDSTKKSVVTYDDTDVIDDSKNP